MNLVIADTKHPVVERGKIPPLEKQVVNRLLRQREPISQTEFIDGMPACRMRRASLRYRAQCGK